MVTRASKVTLTVNPVAPWPHFERDEIEAAVRVLESGNVNYWTGEEGREFEKEFAGSVNCKYAVAVANGTVALELALRTLDVGPGDEVITTPRTFIASASCAVMVGARPIMAEIDRVSQNITAATIERVITPRTKAIIAVHLAGWPCEMDAIMELARSRGVYVIEDCAQAHGATYKDRPVGSLGDIAAFSFCQDKIMSTAGEGGMVTVNSADLYERAWGFKDHGKSFDAVYRRQHPPGFSWLYESFGTNWRMTEIQSAIGRVQLQKLPGWVKTRRAHAQRFNSALADVPAVRLTIPPAYIGHSYYKYYAFLEPSRQRDGWNRDRVVDEINARGVPCQVGGCSEIYLEKAFSPALRPAERLPLAKELGETSIMLQVHPTLSAGQIDFAAEVVRDVALEASAHGRRRDHFKR
jgi:dTDP-4-amino-4,6-dideoxygalactose transaminase